MPLVTTQVETFPHRSVAEEEAGEEVDTDGFPFGDDFFSGLVPVVIEHEAPASNGVLRCIGLIHQRSYEVTRPEASGHEPPTYWRDRNGNIFTALVTKGNNFSEAKIIKPASDYNLFGLQGGEALLRTVRASRLMREAGVDAEWIVRVEEPTQLNFKGELIAPAEYRRRMILELIGRAALSLEGAIEFGLKEIPDEKEVGNIAQAIDKTEFFITLRAMATPYRVNDLIGASYLNYDGLQEVFNTYNLVAPFRQEDFEMLGLPLTLNLPPFEKMTEPDSDIRKYLTEVLPKLIGLNLARMHSIKPEDSDEQVGLTHGFLHLGNVTALGGIVDLDSVKGTAIDLNDSPQGHGAVALDIVRVLNSETLTDFSDTLDQLLVGSGEQFRTLFTNNLLETYMKVRFDKIEITLSEELEFLVQLNEYSGYALLHDRINELAGPYIGELIETETAKLVQEPLTIEAEFMAAKVYQGYILGHENWLYEMGHLPAADTRRPTAKEIENAMRQSFSGDMVVGEDIFKEALGEYLFEDRGDQVFKHSAELKTKIRAKIANTPLESISDEVLESLLICHPMEAVEASITNCILPEADKVWEILRTIFEDLYLDKKFGDNPSPDTVSMYFALLQHGNELIEQIKNAANVSVD